MQRIERYGVLALVFLLVTIVTFALWDDGSKGADEVAAAEKSAAKSTAQRGNTTQQPGRRPLSSTESARLAQQQKQQAEQRRRQQEARLRREREEAAGKQSLNERWGQAAAGDQGLAKNTAAPTGGAPNKGAGTQPQFDLTSKPTIDAPAKLQIGQDPSASRGTKPAPSQAPTQRPTADPREMDLQRRRGTHEVRSGETLSAIAAKSYGDAEAWRAIAAANPGVDPNRLVVGQTLVLPAPTEIAANKKGGGAPTASAPAAPTVEPGPGGTYTVRSGDVLSRIAQDHLGTVKRVPEILALNPGLVPERMYAGQVIRMPAGADPQVASAGRTAAPANARRDDRPRVR